MLPPGIHHYPFRFKLPARIPPTYAGKHAKIAYELRAYVDVPAALDPTHKRTLCIRSPKAVTHPARLKKTVAKSGNKITLQVKVDPSRWSEGGELTGHFTLDNQTDKHIRAVVMTVVREERSRASSSQRTETRKLRQKSFHVDDGKGLPQEQSFALKFPHGKPAFAAKLVSVSYYVKVELDIAWGFDARFQIPLRFKHTES